MIEGESKTVADAMKRLVLLLGVTTNLWDKQLRDGQDEDAKHTNAVCEGILGSISVVLGKSIEDTRALILRSAIESLAK